jgi:hypothetical protein
MTENEISYKIRGAIFKVYNALGPGLLESAYEAISEVHHKQVITYLKLSDLKLGLLVNFNCEDIQKSIYRKVNKL